MMLTKPRLKPSHSVTRSAEGDIAIGELAKNSYIVRNPPEVFLDLLLLLDGTRTFPRIARALQRKHDVSEEQIIKVVSQLADAHLLDDGALESATLSSVEIERYDRQQLQFSAYETQGAPGFRYQEKLKLQLVCVLGMGGWGTWMSLNLALAGFGTLRLVDADFVEVSNLNRQVLYDNSSVGQPKVLAAKSALARVNPHVNVEVVQEFVEPDPIQVAHIIEGASLICLCWANQSHFVKGTAEQVLHQAALERRIPIIEIAGDPFDIAIGPIYPNDGTGPCLKCVRPQMQKLWWGTGETVSTLRKVSVQASPIRKVNAWQSAPSLSAIAGLATNEALKIATGYTECGLLGKRLNINLESYATSLDEFAPAPGCVWCSLIRTAE
ncbi:MAG: HesA/MoeB/ThiF family protein [Pseudonocardiaceae bacterium]